MTDYDREKAARFATAVPARTPEMVARHRARAVDQLARHMCSTDLTDGFCTITEGECRNPARGNSWSPSQNCMVRAEGLMQAIETVGCAVVWAYDKQIIGVSDGQK